MRPLPIVCLVVLAPLLAACAGRPQREEVVVFAAASLRDALEEVGAAFEAQTGTRVVFNFAGSNVLARQIVAAPSAADVFVSASTAWMDSVARAGRVAPGTEQDLLSNTLVVVARQGAALPHPCALSTLPFDHLAMGDPDAVPAGRYARDWLASVDCGGRALWEAVRERVAPAPDARAALALVLADPDVVGIVYRTDWMASAGRTHVRYEVTDGPPIRYVLARLQGGAHPAGAAAFVGYLAGAEARAVFERYGFVHLSPAPSP